MFGWFKPFKDYIDMYYEAGLYKGRERVDEAVNIFKEMKANVTPDISTYNSLMKVQLSGGLGNSEKVFDTYNELVKIMDPNVSTYIFLLRACALIDNASLAEEIYGYAIYRFKIKEKNDFVGIQLYNAMLDVYAEARNDRIYPFFEQMIQKELPIDGMSFNTFAKAMIFLDQRYKLVFLPEMMRIEGVLQKELSKPVRQEIFEAMGKHSFEYKARDNSPKVVKEEIVSRAGLWAEFRNPSHILMNKWGREEDIHDFHIYKDIKPVLGKYLVDPSKVLKPDFTTMHTYDSGHKDPMIPDDIKGPVYPK